MAGALCISIRRLVITLENIIMRFGGLHAVDDVSFAITKGEITGLIGPNGCLLYTSPSPRD